MRQQLECEVARPGYCSCGPEGRRRKQTPGFIRGHQKKTIRADCVTQKGDFDFLSCKVAFILEIVVKGTLPRNIRR